MQPKDLNQPLSREHSHLQAVENTLNTEIICPDCKSRSYRRNGKVLGKQQYKCNICSRKFVLDPYNRSDVEFVVCRWCGGSNHRKKGIAKKTGKRKCYCLDCKRQFTVGATAHGYCLEAPLEFTEDHDIWTAEHLGYENGIHYHNKLNFSDIKQHWLRINFKKFILFLSRTRIEFSTLINKIAHIKTFSLYLSEISYAQDFSRINRVLIVDFLVYLKRKQFSYSTTIHTLSTLKTLFETGVLNDWFYVEPSLIRPEDWPKKHKRLPRFIPEEVMSQLNQHLDALPEPVMRMVLVHIECGFRIGELTRLKIDCLKSDGRGGQYIHYQMYKMKKEHTKPISLELVKVIQEQQQYIKTELGEHFPYLFCGRTRFSSNFVPEAKLMSGQSFTRHLKKLAEEFDIKDCSGNHWDFQSHQFRHTVGTRMINAGVPQHIVQKYLGHECADMTMVYAYVHDATLRKEIDKYHESTVVNFQGETVELEKNVLASNNDLEWFRKNVLAMALPHGYCGRPKVLGYCDLPPESCYSCSYWRTNKNFLPVLKDTLERTNNILNKAQNYGWELQLAKNKPIKENLEKVIDALEVS